MGHMDSDIHPMISNLHKCSSDYLNDTFLPKDEHHKLVCEPSDLCGPVEGTSLTVVLDIDETLVRAHCEILEISIRPGALELLDYLSNDTRIELIFWTAGVQFHAYRCLMALQEQLQSKYETKLKIDGVIYRGVWYRARFKDVFELAGRMDRCLLVDNSETCHIRFGCGLLIPSYDSNKQHDCEVMMYSPPLKVVVSVCEGFLRYGNIPLAIRKSDRVSPKAFSVDYDLYAIDDPKESMTFDDLDIFSGCGLPACRNR